MSTAPRFSDSPRDPGRRGDVFRIPPHNLEAERCVLGSMLLDNGSIDEVAAILRPADFFRDIHADLFRSIAELHRRGVAADGITLAEDLESRGQLAKVGGDETILRLLEATPHAANARYYAQIVQQKAIARALIAAADSILEDCYSNDFDADELIERAQRAVLDVGKSRTDAGLTDAAGAVKESLYRFACRDEGIRTGVPSGFADLDGMTGGFQPGQLVVVAARPSIGKSAIALNIAERLAFRDSFSGRDPVPVLFVSLEMNRGELGDRMVCGRAGVDSFRFVHSHLLSDVERARLARAGEELSVAPIYIDDSSGRTVTQIASNARRYKATRGIGMLVVDYLQLVRPDEDSGRRPRHEVVAEISCRFKALAKDLGIPVMLLSQLNREVEKRDEKRPQLSDIRESGAVEQDANTILLLHRPEFYDADESPGQAELIVAKNRSGPTGTVRLAFQKGITRFTDFIEPAFAGRDGF
jgi:replicative DNA helicase